MLVKKLGIALNTETIWIIQLLPGKFTGLDPQDGLDPQVIVTGLAGPADA